LEDCTGNSWERYHEPPGLPQSNLEFAHEESNLKVENLSSLKLIHREESGPEPLCPIYLLCVFRDERLLLEYFVSYYQSLGVTHFIFVDNLSQDGGPEYLQNLNNVNLLLYSTKESYREANYGTKWINQLLETHCTGQFCFTVDVDELFLLDTRKFASLNQLAQSMIASNSNVIPATLLDMYPSETNDDYVAGGDFLQHSRYFDEFNSDYYEEWGTIYDSFSHKVGGVRKRVLGTTVCIHKLPFIRFDFQPLGVATGYHFFQEKGKVIMQSEKIRLFDTPAILLHFKFIKPKFKEFIGKRIANNQDWNDSAEYRSYEKALGREPVLKFIDPRYSRKLNSIRDLGSFI
jgi:hypothetical protein